MNEMHLDHERKLNQLRVDLQSEHAAEIKTLNQKHQQQLQKLDAENTAKEQRIRTLEKTAKNQTIERDKLQAVTEQLNQLQERTKNIQTDRDLIEQEKRMLQERLDLKERSTRQLEEKLQEHGLKV